VLTEVSGSKFIDQEEFGIQPTCNTYSGGANYQELSNKYMHFSWHKTLCLFWCAAFKCRQQNIHCLFTFI